jgi:hypothetical protein
VHCAQAHYERHLYSQFPKNFVPYRCLHLISPIFNVERRIYVSVGNKTFFKIIGEIRCRCNSIGNLKTNEIDLLNFILQIIFNGKQKITIFID